MGAARPSVVDDRLFKDVYVCMRCNATIRAKNISKVKCRKCGSKKLRPKKKQMRTATKK